MLANTMNYPYADPTMQAAQPFIPPVVDSPPVEDWRSGDGVLWTPPAGQYPIPTAAVVNYTPAVATSYTPMYSSPVMVTQEGLPGATHPSPARQYVCDGYAINDEIGNVVARVVALKNNAGTDVVSPMGEPWLRYEKRGRAVRDLRTNTLFAVMAKKERAVLWGSSAHWKKSNEATLSVAPRIYTYNVQESDGVNLHIWVYDAKTRRHIATVTRLSSGAYPSRIAIFPDTRYHLLLCTLFLV